MRRATELLARLKRHALDEQRLALAASTAELERRRAEIAALEERLGIEHALAFALPGGPQPLAAYARVSLARARALRDAEADTGRDVAKAEEELRERLRSWKGLDLVARRLSGLEAQQAERASRLETEEAAALRAAAS